MSVTKITEELDRSQKKCASLREIVKTYPDTIVKRSDESKIYSSASINKDINDIGFGMIRTWVIAYPFKRIGCINVYSYPESFKLLEYWPGDIFKELIIQNYCEIMRKHNISDAIIRECDLKVVSFLKDQKVNISQTNIKDLNQDSTLSKLLLLL